MAAAASRAAHVLTGSLCLGCYPELPDFKISVHPEASGQAMVYALFCAVPHIFGEFSLGPHMGWGFSLKLTLLLSFPSLLSLGSYKAKLGEVSCLLPLTIPISFPSFLLFSPLPLRFSSSFLIEK